MRTQCIARLIGAQLAFLSLIAAAAEPENCRVVRDGTRVELRSPFFTFYLDAHAGLTAEAWDNIQTGERISLGSGPELGVDLGEPDLRIETPELLVMVAPPSSASGGTEGEAVFNLSTKEPLLTARVTYRWNTREPVLRKFVQIESTVGREFRLLNVRLGTYKTPARLIDREQGFPVYIGDGFFMSLAHPAGWATAKDGEVSLRQYPGIKVAVDSAFDCMEAVYGVGTAGAARASFLAHLHSRMRRVVRGHDRPYAIFDNFGSWPSGEFLNSEAEELHSLNLLDASQAATGCRFDLCNIHFWVDSLGDMKRWDPVRFPNGIERIKPVLDALGTAPGLWIGSASTWGNSWSIGPNPGVRASLSDDAGWFCRASEPIRSMFRDAFVCHIRDEGVRLLKFDTFNAMCNNPAHDHLPGLYSTEAIDNAVIEFLHDLDRECPELFVILYWGYRSPWWLLHGDTLFDSGIGIEAASPSSQPALHARDSVTQKLDQAQWYAADVPALGKDSLGIWLSNWGWNSSIGKERWQQGFVMDICRGSMLAQIWADYEWLSAPEWRELADFIALLRAHPACFGNPRFIAGNPWNDEPYGYCCSDGRRAFLAINNCTWHDRVVPLRLDAACGLPLGCAWDLYRWYPAPARLRGDAEHFGAEVSLLMRPFETDLLEVVPAGAPASLDRDFPSVPMPSTFTEAACELDLRVHPAPERFDPADWTVLRPSGATSLAGATMTEQADESIFVSGLNPVPDSYFVTADTRLTGITGVRLEVLDDPNLPSNGPGRAFNGNFALSEFRVTMSPQGDPTRKVVVPLCSPAASFSQKSFGGWPIEAAIDGNPATGWSIDPREGYAHAAVFQTESPVGFVGGTTFRFELLQTGPRDHTIGHFRLSVTTANTPLVPPEPQGARRLLVTAQAPATARGGALVITAELARSGAAIQLRDIGTYFNCEARVEAESAECTPVLGTATYPSSWQAWRVVVSPGAVPRPVEFLISASLPRNVECALRAHYCPAAEAP